MSSLKILLKNEFNILIGRLQGKKQRRSTEVATYLLCFGLIVLLAIYSYEAYIMFDEFCKLGLGKLCMFHACTTTLSVLVILGTMRTSVNERNNDADFLLSLPIKKHYIVITKTLSKYLFDLFFVLLLFVPYVVIYQIKCGLDLTVLILGIILTFILPLTSLGISYIFDFLIKRVFNKSKFSSFLKSVVLLLIFIVVMGLMLSATANYDNIEIVTMEEYFAGRPISNLFLSFMFNPNIKNILFVLTLTIVPFVLGMVLYTKDYGKIFLNYHSKATNLKFNSRKSTFSLLFKKEIYTYATTPAYIINTIIGPIMMIALAIFLAVTGERGIVSLFGLNLPKELICSIVVLIFCGLSSTSTISASSISLEGKNIWILKSSPVDTSDVFNSKAAVHFALIEPFLILATIIISIVFKFDILSIAMLVVLPMLHVLILSYGGVLINLWQPNLDWDDASKVVKQSLSVLLTMVFGLILTLIPLGVYKLFSSVAISVIFAISALIYLVILIAILIILFFNGKEMFEKL